MRFARLLGSILIVAGLALFFVGPFLMAGGTQRACPGIDGVVYETVGIDPGEAEVVGLDGLTLEWYDGCNWRTGSLAPSLVGAGGVGFGVVLQRR